MIPGASISGTVGWPEREVVYPNRVSNPRFTCLLEARWGERCPELYPVCGFGGVSDEESRGQLIGLGALGSVCRIQSF
jgi:hypothetical protein